MNDVFDAKAWSAVIVSSMSELGSRLAGFLPNLIGVFVILFVGWLISRVVSTVASRLLSRVGIDTLCERVGVMEILRNVGVEANPSAVVGRLIFWVLMLTFLLSAAETLGLEAVTATIDRLIGYLPNVIAAAFIVVFGIMLARFAGTAIASGASAANLTYARQLGSAAQGAVTLMVGVVTIEQLGIDTQILLQVITVVVAAAALGLGLSFALGSGDVVKAILASHYIRQSLAEGDVVEVDGRRGRVERIGPTDTLFRDGEQSWTIPNSKLLNEVVVR